MFLLSSLFFCEFSFFGITKLERWGLLFLVFLFFYSTARILGFLSFFKSASSTSISSSPQPSDFRFSLKGLRRWNDIDIYYSPLSFSFPLFFFFTCLGWFLHVLFSFSGDSHCFFLGGEAKRRIRKVRVCSSSFSSANHLISFLLGRCVECQLSWDRVIVNGLPYRVDIFRGKRKMGV